LAGTEKQNREKEEGADDEKRKKRAAIAAEKAREKSLAQVPQRHQQEELRQEQTFI